MSGVVWPYHEYEAPDRSMTAIDSYHQLLDQRIRQQQKETEMADSDMNVKVSVPVSVSRFLDALARFLEPSDRYPNLHRPEGKPAEGPMTTGHGHKEPHLVVGRIVHFNDNDASTCQAAIVTLVRPGDFEPVDLTVFGSGGVVFNAQNVIHVDQPRSWHWPFLCPNPQGGSNAAE